MVHTNTFPAGQLESAGEMNFVVVDVDITSYDAPEVITAGEFNMTIIHQILIIPTENAVLLTTNAANTNINAYDATFTEESGTTDVGTMRLLIFGH